MSDRPTGLRIDSGGDQFPVSEASPRLSWRPIAGEPAGYHLEAIVDGTPQAPVTVGADAFRFTDWPWPPLRSCQQVAWRARAGGAEHTEWSDWHRFEAGLLDPDWSARWISPVEQDNAGYGQRPAQLLSTTFELASAPTAARLYATALGIYEAFLNGQRVGTTELAPGATSYDRTVYAQAYDASGLLRAGTNRLELVLSDGWYRGQVAAFRIPAGWGTTLAVRAELHADGALVASSGPQWTSQPSEIIRADLMDGQTTDFQVEPSPTVPVLVDQVEAPPTSWSPAPPVRVVETSAPVAVTRVADGTWVADFGQNASGWIRLADLGPAGTRTTIDYGEYVGPDVDLDTSHLDSMKPGEPPIRFVQRDEVISAGGGEAFEPRHTVHGFRYARLAREGDLDPTALAMQVVHSDLVPTGSFECNDPDLTRLWEVARWSFRGNAVDIPTDCPTRERVGWTGDYQVFISTATRLYDVLGFSRKWLQSVRDDQLDDGRIANFSPDGRRVKHNLGEQFAMMTGSAGWGDAIVEVPWQLYLAYGDRQALAENYDAMVRWVDWALGTARSARHPSRVERSAEPLPHEQYLWDGSFHWGEWCEPKPKAADGTPIDPLQTNPMAWFMADKGEVGTAFLHRSAATLARIAGLLGHAESAARYHQAAEQVREAWRTEFLTADGRTTTDTQASYVRALSFGLMPAELRDAAAARLAELVAETGDHLTTGFLATADLLPVLADTGHADAAYRVLFQRTSPSWLAMLDRGATTIWEDWDGIDDHGKAHDSLNHYSKGAVVRFLHSHALGLRQAEGSTAWESFVIAPVLHPSLSWARGSLNTPQGLISVEWQRDGSDLTVIVEVPPASNGALVSPDGHTVPLTPGRAEHRWTVSP